LKRRNVFLFFALPFAGVFFFFALASFLGQADLKRRTEGLVRAQLAATADILRVTVAHYLDEGVPPDRILDLLLSGEDIYFIALLDAQRTVLAWNSRFEGYLPLSLREAREEESGIIDSPAGKIFSDLSTVSRRDGSRYYLYLGYALTGMEEMIALSRRTSFLLSGLFLLAGAAFFRAMFVLQSRFVAKAREAEAERLEKERFKEISAFTSGVAHEIKNPLNSLSLLLELLLQKAPPEAKEGLDLGKAQVQAIARIVDGFSSAVRPVRPVAAALDLEEVLLRALDKLTAEAPDAAARVRVETEPGVRLRGDGELLSQALLNLLKNAVEASPSAPVRVEGRRTKKRIEIRVRDEGPGIPPDALVRIFEPFFTTKDKGMGVGLFLARKIIEAHGGTLDARSKEGEGTEVRAELPGG
jgi:signal transduction histidine kinase